MAPRRSPGHAAYGRETLEPLWTYGVEQGANNGMLAYRKDNGAGVARVTTPYGLGTTMDDPNGMSVRKMPDGSYVIVRMNFLNKNNCVDRVFLR